MFQMPQLIDDTDFDMAKVATNLMHLAEVETHDPVTLIDNERYAIVEQTRGEHRIVMKDKSDGRMVYIVECEMNYTPTGLAVTQVMVWRDPDRAITQGITEHVFNDVLLPRFGIIISDRTQTRDGERFWRGRMAQAVERGDRVGLATMSVGHIDWYDPKNQTFPAWIADRMAWGTDDRFQDLRFIIAR